MCRICLGPHDTNDCPDLIDSDPRSRRLGCGLMIGLSALSWFVIWWMTTTGIFDAIDAWRAPWQ